MDFQTKLNCTEAVLKDFLQNNSTITSLELKQELIKQHPTETWLQQWCSDFLMNSGLSFSDNGTYRTYISNTTIPQSISPLKQLTTADVISASNKLENNNQHTTKVKLKSILRLNDYDLTDFNSVFNACGFEHTGKYTVDNHKIWVIKQPGKHFSKTKQKPVAINDMPKPYLINALFDKYESSTLGEILSGSTESEVYQMLKALFTFEVRKALNV